MAYCKLISDVSGAKEDKYKSTLNISLTVLIILSMILNIRLMNRTVGLFPQLKFVPCNISLIVITQIICGGVILSEFKRYNLQQMAFIITGSFICITGLYLKVFKDSWCA